MDGYISRIEEKTAEWRVLEVFGRPFERMKRTACKERKMTLTLDLFSEFGCVKDNILVSGKIASSGSKILDGMCHHDATVISRLKKQARLFWVAQIWTGRMRFVYGKHGVSGNETR